MSPSHEVAPDVPRGRALRKLALWSSLLGGFWFAFLPWLAGQPEMRKQLDWLDERRIDPSAMYYTELEAMKPILERLNRRGR